MTTRKASKCLAELGWTRAVVSLMEGEGSQSRNVIDTYKYAPCVLRCTKVILNKNYITFSASARNCLHCSGVIKIIYGLQYFSQQGNDLSFWQSEVVSEAFLLHLWIYLSYIFFDLYFRFIGRYISHSK